MLVSRVLLRDREVLSTALDLDGASVWREHGPATFARAALREADEVQCLASRCNQEGDQEGARGASAVGKEGAARRGPREGARPLGGAVAGQARGRRGQGPRQEEKRQLEGKATFVGKKRQRRTTPAQELGPLVVVVSSAFASAAGASASPRGAIAGVGSRRAASASSSRRARRRVRGAEPRRFRSAAWTSVSSSLVRGRQVVGVVPLEPPRRPGVAGAAARLASLRRCRRQRAATTASGASSSSLQITPFRPAASHWCLP